MDRKSKRYFRHDKRSHSPPESSRRDKYTNANFSKHKTDYSKDNKSASEKLKKTIQNQLKESSTVGRNFEKNPHQEQSKIYISLEEQVKLASKIDEINNDSFKIKSFTSSRNYNSKNNVIDLDSIPLPKDDNSWRENANLVLNSKLYVGTIEERKQKWRSNLLELSNELQKTIK